MSNSYAYAMAIDRARNEAIEYIKNRLEEYKADDNTDDLKEVLMILEKADEET